MKKLQEKPCKMLWIDDEVSESIALHDSDPEIEFKCIHPKKLIDWFLVENREVENQEVDIILVDYKLNTKADDLGETYSGLAPTIIGWLWIYYPITPIFLISQIITEEIAGEENQIFDLLLPRGSLNDASLFKNETENYRKLGQICPGSLTDIYTVLDTPDSSADLIELALPTEFKKGLSNDASSILQPQLTAPSPTRFAKWVRNQLLKNPGPLYDNLYAATALGMTLDYFENHFLKSLGYRPAFADARYKGVFANVAPTHWWKLEIYAFLFSQPSEDEITVTDSYREAAKILDVPNECRSTCIKCKSFFPETVAMDADDRSERFQVHISCSYPDDSQLTSPLFEQKRLVTIGYE